VETVSYPIHLLKGDAFSNKEKLITVGNRVKLTVPEDVDRFLAGAKIEKKLQVPFLGGLVEEVEVYTNEGYTPTTIPSFWSRFFCE